MKRKFSPLTFVAMFLSIINALLYGLDGNVGAGLGWLVSAIYALLYLISSSEVKRK